MRDAASGFAQLALCGQTNFLRGMMRFGSVYHPDALLADHAQPIAYELPQPPPVEVRPNRTRLYVHARPELARTGSGGG